MILKKGSFADFAHQVKKTGNRVIVYGAGVIGQTSAPYWLYEYQLDEAVLCFVDADPHKQGQAVPLHSRSVPIKPPQTLEEIKISYTLLVTVSAFVPVVQALERLRNTKDVECWFLPVMLLDLARRSKTGGVIHVSDTPLIPKKIHYTWFSGESIPENLRICIESWRHFCPDYEIIQWNADNYDVSKYEYTKQAYIHQKWGFIADMARLDIVYKQGGIYLDADVELLRSLDELLYQPGFLSTEKWGIVSGAAFGAKAGNSVIKSMLDYRRTFPFLRPDGTLDRTSSGTYDTLPLIKQGMQVNGETQIVASGEMVVYSFDFFHPYDYASGEIDTTKNTFAIHHFDGGWLGEDEAGKRAETRRQYQDFLTRLED